MNRTNEPYKYISIQLLYGTYYESGIFPIFHAVGKAHTFHLLKHISIVDGLWVLTQMAHITCTVLLYESGPFLALPWL